MTFIHSSHHKNWLTRTIVLLMVALFTGTFGLILLYNKMVDLNHEIAKTKSQLELVGAASTQLNNQVIALTGGGKLTNVASEDGLVLDNKPQYFPVLMAGPKQAVAVK
jgi:cell division protein FtsL